MNTREIEIIKKSYKSIQPRMSRVTRVLFDRLFETNPELRPLFHSDLRDLRKKIVRKFDYVIAHLHEPEVLGPELKKLGAHHNKQFKVTQEHYNAFINALIYALSAAFGSEFTPELRKTWRYVLGVVAQIMQSGK
jgi:hemoglobin-like flavoprotein